MATKNNRHKKKPKMVLGKNGLLRSAGPRRVKARLSDGKPHPITVRRVDPS